MCSKNEVGWLLAYIIKNNINFTEMAAKQLGVKVLTKIENLICEIDRPNVISSGRKKEVNQISIGEYVVDKDKVYSNLSNTYLKKCNKVNRILKDEVYQEEKPYEKFRVTNKTSLKILHKKEVKPIHQRVKDILTKKDKYVKRIQLHDNQKQMEAMKPVHRSIDSLVSRKFHQSDLQEYRQVLDQKNKERIKKQHMKKLTLVKTEDSKIPRVDHVSRSLSSRRNLKKNYSGNVFARMVQYGYQQSTKKIQLLKNRRKQQGNFTPVLCSKSIEIAQRLKTSMNKSEKSLHHHSHCQHRTEKIVQPPQPKPKKSPLKVEKKTPLKEKVSNTKVSTEKQAANKGTQNTKASKQKQNTPTLVKTMKKK